MKEEYVYMGLTTICQITMGNGFTVLGVSTCKDPADYHKEIGEKYALDEARKEVEKYMAFRWKEEHGGDFRYRLEVEKDRLENKIKRLGAFLGSSMFGSLVQEEQDDMQEQYAYMKRYLDVLVRRLERHHV